MHTTYMSDKKHKINFIVVVRDFVLKSFIVFEAFSLVLSQWSGDNLLLTFNSIYRKNTS